jgi:hypothetical protein
MKGSIVSVNPEEFIEIGGPGGPSTHLALGMSPDARSTPDGERAVGAKVASRKEAAFTIILDWTGDNLLAIGAWLKERARLNRDNIVY